MVFFESQEKIFLWKYTRNKLFIKNNGLIHHFFGSPGNPFIYNGKDTL